MTYSNLRRRQWPEVPDCPEKLRFITSNLLQTHVLIRKSVQGLSDEALWRRHREDLYSIGNALMHVCGSEHEWITHGVGGRPKVRDRDAEFATLRGASLAQLLATLDEQEAQTRQVLRNLTDADLQKEFQGDCSVEFILHYQAQHLAYHAGQILMLRRLQEPGFNVV